MLLAPRLTFRSNLANWNALFPLNYVWQLGGETGLLNHLPGFQWDWLILLMSLKHCKHCCAALAIRVKRTRVIECVLKQTFKYWSTQKWSGPGLEVSGKCQGVLNLSPDNALGNTFSRGGDNMRQYGATRLNCSGNMGQQGETNNWFSQNPRQPEQINLWLITL